MKRIPLALTAVAVLAVSTGCGNAEPTDRDTKVCRVAASQQRYMDETQGQNGDLRAAVLADYIALPGLLTKAGVDDDKLKESLAAAQAKHAEAAATIPIEGAQMTVEAMKPFRDRCAELVK